METEVTLEQIRQSLTLVGRAIEQMDTLSDKINEARWNFEAISRKPELGKVQDPRTGQVHTFLPEHVFENIQHLTAQRDSATEILLALTGKTTVEEARQAYLAILMHYKRLGALVEVQQSMEAGYPTDSAALREVTNNNLISDEIKIATEKLKAVAIVVPPAEQRLIQQVSSLALG